MSPEQLAAGRMANALSVIYRGEEWLCNAEELTLVNPSGMRLRFEDIARCTDGYQLKMLIDNTRESWQVRMLENALTWTRGGPVKADGADLQASATMVTESQPVPACSLKERHGEQ